MKENYFSAATVVAYTADPNFDGMITYNAPDDGIPDLTNGVEVWAAGQRNPFGITLHSNGFIYGTDNGPNLGYVSAFPQWVLLHTLSLVAAGRSTHISVFIFVLMLLLLLQGDMKTGCAPNEFIPDVETEDKVNILLQGSYLGHPNARRASADNDDRQCAWRHPTSPSGNGFTAPLTVTPSSAGAIMEFESDSFGGQMRGNLIFSKYTDGLYRVILAPGGQAVIPQTDPPIALVGDGGLGVTQAPDGSLVEVRLSANELWVHQPVEDLGTDLWVNTVWPRRCGSAGGPKMMIYGKNLDKNGTPTVTVGGSDCPVVFSNSIKVRCTLPGGSGIVDVVVTSGTESYTFKRGFRYATGAR